LRDITSENPVVFGNLTAFSGTFSNRSTLDVVAAGGGNLITGYVNGASGDRFNVKLNATDDVTTVSSGGGYDLKLFSESGKMVFEGASFMESPTFDFNGSLTATAFIGDGSLLNNLPQVDYADLANKPTLPSKLSDLANDVGFTTFSGDYNALSNRPDFSGFDQDASDDFSGDYADLANKPTLPNKLTTSLLCQIN